MAEHRVTMEANADGDGVPGVGGKESVAGNLLCASGEICSWPWLMSAGFWTPDP